MPSHENHLARPLEIQEAQTSPKRKAGKRTPESKRSRVIAKKLLGKSNRQIAREEGMNHHTVGHIIDDSEFRDVVKSYRSQILELIPKSIKAYNATLDGLETPAYMKPETKEIEVLDGEQLKKRLDDAYRAGLSKGMDIVKVSTEVLKGTQALTSKEEIALSTDEQARALTPEERKTEIAALLKRLRATE